MPAQHPQRRVLALTEFHFAREVVAHNGKVSVDPAILLKLMSLLFQENVRGDREQMRRLPEGLDWLRFLGYGLEDASPDHCVRSKARKRWGGALIETLFVRTVGQCIGAGLVDGTKVHLDGGLIDADASRDSVVKADAATITRIKAAYAAQERKLDDTAPLAARCCRPTRHCGRWPYAPLGVEAGANLAVLLETDRQSSSPLRIWATAPQCLVTLAKLAKPTMQFTAESARSDCAPRVCVGARSCGARSPQSTRWPATSSGRRKNPPTGQMHQHG